MDNSLFSDSQFSKLILLGILFLPLKLWAGWRAARNNSKGWFVVLMLINTFGLLELTYLFYFSKPKTPKDS